jgi:hypothetical protein
MIGMKKLRPEQNIFLDLLTNVGCMSSYQAIHIFKNYLGVNGTTIAMNDLSYQRAIKYSSDQKFVTKNSFSVKEKIDRNIIEDIAVMMHIFDKCIEKNGEKGLKEIQDSLGFVYRPQSEFELEFISESVIYRLIHIPSDQLFKMKVIEKRMLAEKANSASEKHYNDFSVTLFMFSGSVKEERVLDKIEELGLPQIAHRLVFIQGNTFDKGIGFNIYGN